jgi:hypothetical protein
MLKKESSRNEDFSDGFFEKQIRKKLMCFVLAQFNSYFYIKCVKRVFFVHEKVFYAETKVEAV